MEQVTVGKIVNVRGLRGELKVLPQDSDLELFQDSPKVWCAGKAYNVKRAVPIKNCVGLLLEGIETVEEAQKMIGSAVSLPADQFPPTEEGVYYIRDLIGMAVYREDGTPVGTLTEVWPTGARDVYRVVGENGAETLIPAVGEFIKTVDMEKKEMTVHLIDGMTEAPQDR